MAGGSTRLCNARLALYKRVPGAAYSKDSKDVTKSMSPD